MVIIEDLVVVDTIVQTAEDCSYLIDCGGTAECEVKMTMKERVTALDDVTDATIVFDTTADTITRDKGSWLEGGFRVGMEVTITSSVSNDGTLIIVTVTDEVITVVAVTADETISSNTVDMTGLIPDTDWVAYETIGAGLKKHTVIEMSGTGLRFVKSGGTGTIRVWVRS